MRENYVKRFRKIIENDRSANSNEEDLDKINDEIIKSGFEDIIDGHDPSIIKSILEIKLDTLLRKTETRYKIAIEGIMGILEGNNPRIVKEKLEAFI